MISICHLSYISTSVDQMKARKTPQQELKIAAVNAQERITRQDTELLLMRVGQRIHAVLFPQILNI